MQYSAKRALRHLVFEDAAAIVVGLAGVYDERQAGCACGSDMCPKAALLGFAGAVLVEIIQTRLAERHDLGMTRQIDQLVRRNTVFFIGLMRMRADRAVDLRKSLRDRQQSVQAADPRRDSKNATDA